MIIADTDVYRTSDGRSPDLRWPARYHAVNASIHAPEYHYRFNNHTLAANSPHKEQRSRHLLYADR